MSAFRTLCLLGVGLLAGCRGAGDLADPSETGLDRTLIVSDAAPAVDEPGTPTSPTTYAYVSLPAGSIPGGASATVRNRATGVSAAAVIVDGAVDPVRIPASTGDTLELTATDGGGDQHHLANEVKGRVPPVVTRSEPGRGATDAPTLLRVRVVFSEPVAVASVTASTVTVLLRDQVVAGTVLLSPEGLFAEFVPEDSLVAGATYIVLVTRGVRDRTGDPLAEEYRSEFTVAPYTGPTIAFASVVTGSEFSCALGRSVEVYCWGRGDRGQVGIEGPAAHRRPSLLALPGRIVELGAGLRAVCALTDARLLLCWGSPTQNLVPNQFGKPDPIHPVPTPLLGTDPMLHVAMGGGRVCALDQTKSLICVSRYFPEPQVWIADSSLSEVSVGWNHDCYVSTDRTAYCYGSNWFGQLGDGTAGAGAEIWEPVRVAGGLAFTSITTGLDFTCGLADLRAYCWGWNVQGELGLGTHDEVHAPAPVAGGLEFALIDAGHYHTCALTPEGAAYCWGDNRAGQLGDGTRIERPAPVPVQGGLRFRTISASVDHTCGVAVDDVLYCWGGNRFGQLGDGSTAGAPYPIKAAYQR